MRKLLAGLVTAITLSASFTANANITTWNVEAANFTIHVNPNDYFRNDGDMYRLSNLVGELNTSAGPSQLTMNTSDEWANIGLYFHEYSLSVNYRFHYDLYDFHTGELVSSNTSDLKIVNWAQQIATHTPNPADAGGSFNTKFQGTAETDSSFLRSVDLYNPATGMPILARLTASGSYPDDFTLTYGPLDGQPGELASGSVVYFGLNHHATGELSWMRDNRFDYSGTLALTPAIPEPETYLLMAMGLTGLLATKRSRKARVITE